MSREAARTLPNPAAAGAPTTPQAQRLSPGGGTNTLHVEYAVWSRSYRIIHTRPDGRRIVWRRGIENLEDAVLRARYVADLCGYHFHTPTGRTDTA